jgi:hypothetical protein
MTSEMNKTKMGLLAVLALVVAVAAGFLWGAWGRWGLERQLRDSELRAGLADARGALYAARIDLAELNYGKAGGTLDRARKTLERLAGQYDAAGRKDAAATVRDAFARAGEAQQSAASVDQAASGRVAEAIKVLDRIEALPQK